MYSSIEKETRETVIDKCYWPLLNLVTDIDCKIGIEITGLTLELIHEIDEEWVQIFKKLISSGKTELIGSGYSQLIGPIVPAEVNDKNQKIGMDVYQRLLNHRPTIALINEMSYSAGIVEHYLKNGYEAVIMEYNNPSKYHPEWEKNWRYYPQRMKGSDDSIIKLLWADSIAFQKFQRYVHGEINLDEYEQYLNTHLDSEPRYFPLYANDVEIFNFRPGRYKTEAQLSGKDEWKRISNLFQYLLKHKDFSFIFPSKLLSVTDSYHDPEFLTLESPEQPIPVKKQKKYNINRWTLSGRDDLKINTQCFDIYSSLKKGNQSMPEHWKELCYLWSSDFRTHITDNRWEKYIARLQEFHNKVSKPINQVETDKSKVVKNLPFSYQDITVNEENRFLKIRNDTTVLILNKRKGLTVASYHPYKLSKKPVFGTLDHGYYDDISLGADFFSGHAVIEKLGIHKTTDLSEPEFILSHDKDDIHIRSKSISDHIFFETKITNKPSQLVIEKTITLNERKAKTIRPLHFTFNPEAFDPETLFYATNNGGNELEYFYLLHANIQHHRILSPLISSEQGLGATKGIVIIGDQEKKILFKHDVTRSALIPSFEYRQLNEGNYFLRLVYSAQEIDETFKPNNSSYSIASKIEISVIDNKN